MFLGVVIVDRAAQFVGEGLEGPLEGLMDLSLSLGREVAGLVGLFAAEPDLDRQCFGLFERDRAMLHERLRERLGADVYHPGELRDAGRGDDQVGDAAAHVDESDDFGAVAVGRALVDEAGPGRERPHHGERLQVDTADDQAGFFFARCSTEPTTIPCVARRPAGSAV